jgi:hypothetical protein
MRCPRCHITFPREVHICPKCGSRQWRWMATICGWVGLGVVATLLAVLIWPSGGGDESQNKAVAAATTAVTVTAAPTPTTKSGIVLYQADQLGGLDAFAGTAGWSYANGILANDGSGALNGPWIAAPYQPQTADYAVEAEIQIVRVNQVECSGGAGLIARATDDAGYAAGVVYGLDACEDLHLRIGTRARPGVYGGSPIADTKNFSPGASWHTYRLEVKGTSVRLLVDGTLMAEGTDDRYRDAGRIGIWSDGTQVNVRRFAVVAG